MFLKPVQCSVIINVAKKGAVQGTEGGQDEKTGLPVLMDPVAKTEMGKSVKQATFREQYANGKH